MFKKSDTLTKKLPPCCTIQAGKGSQGLHSSDVVTLCMIRSDCLRLLCTDFDHRSHKLSQELSDHDRTKLCILADSGFFKNFQHQGGVKSTVSWVFEDLKFKISEGYDQNWCFPDPAQLTVSVQLRQLTGQSEETINFGCSLLIF